MGALYMYEKLIVAQYGWIGNGEWYNIKLEKQVGLDLAELCRYILRMCVFYPKISAEHYAEQRRW